MNDEYIHVHVLFAVIYMYTLFGTTKLYCTAITYEITTRISHMPVTVFLSVEVRTKLRT